MEISYNTPLAEMTAGQLADYLRSVSATAPSQTAPTPCQAEPRYVYGLKGIMSLFNVSNVTAQRYKAGIIKDAVKQCGRKIVVDADKAIELFNAAREQQ